MATTTPSPGASVALNTAAINSAEVSREVIAAGTASAITPEQAFSTAATALDASVPLLLLPVRLETRFEPAKNPTALRIRVYPDAVHANTHAPALSAEESTLGAAFAAQWNAARTQDAKNTALSALITTLGAARGSWVARVALGKSVGTGASVVQETAALLPDRWLFVGYLDGVQVFCDAGLKIPANLPSGLKDQNWTEGQDIVAWLKAQGLGWMVDFDEAVAKGMAVSIPLTGGAAIATVATQGLDELCVVGIRGGDAPTGASELAAQLERLHHTRGAGFVRQGAATNHTEAGKAESLDDDADAIARRELGTLTLTYDDTQKTGSNARLAARALGLADGSALERFDGAADEEQSREQAALRAIWYGTIGYTLTTVLAKGATPFLSDANRQWIFDWAMANLRAGGPLPTLRVGAQPLGLLPVSLITQGGAPDTETEFLESALFKLRQVWQTATSTVPTLDPTATDSATDAGQDAQAALTAILSGQPYPVRLWARRVSNEVDKVAVTGLGDWNAIVVLFGLLIANFSITTLLEICCNALKMKTTGLPTIATEMANRLKGYTTIDGQKLAWRGLKSWVDSQYNTGKALVDKVTAREGSISQARLDVLNNAAIQAGRTYDLTSQQDYLNRILEMKQAMDWVLRLPQIGEAQTLIDGCVTPLLDAHDQRVSPITMFSLGNSAFQSWVGASQPALAQSCYDDETSNGSAALVQAADATGAALATAWLAAMKTAATTGATPAEPGGVTPLLFRILKQSIAVAPAGHRAALAGAIQWLEQRAGSAKIEDPLGDVERLVRNALGLVSYRLDAWLTGVAHRRLSDKRRSKPTGLRIGGYAWVEKLRPGARPSQGYIHAPSPGQAATAGVLRAGWSAWATDKARDALAVNLRSDRVRVAQWLLDGMRAGQSLGDLLGYRVERRMHDALTSQDEYIDDLRAAVARGLGLGVPARISTVDGLALARAWAGDSDYSKVKAEVDKVLTAAGSKKSALTATLDALASDLDAVADLALADGVFAAVHGNPERAGAMLDAVGAGTGAPPEPMLPRTPRTGISVTHKIVALLASNLASTWTVPAAAAQRSPRALLDVRLDGWLASLIGDPGNIVGAALWTDATSGAALGSNALTVGSLGLEAADLVALAPPQGVLAGSDLEARLLLAARLIRPATVPATAALSLRGDRTGLSATQVSLDELALLLHALRGLLTRARPLDAPDLAGPGVELASTTDWTELRNRFTTAALPLAGLIANLTTWLPAAGQDVIVSRQATASATILNQLLLAWRMGLPDALPRAGWSDVVAKGADSADRLALIDQARAVFEAAKATQAELLQANTTANQKWATWSEAERRAWVEGQTRRLAPGALLLPLFKAGNAADLDASLARDASRQAADPGLAAGWLDQVAAVQPGAAALQEVGLVADALADSPRLPLKLLQLPDADAEPWVGLARPTDNQPRLSITAATAGTVSFAGSLAGLHLDQWVEIIPNASETTGVALHWNAPGAQAPQVALLAVASGAAWSQSELVGVVRQAFENAKLRAVDPADVPTFGHYLPAIFLPALSGSSAPRIEEEV